VLREYQEEKYIVLHVDEKSQEWQDFGICGIYTVV
jgi:hypothetical protein